MTRSALAAALTLPLALAVAGCGGDGDDQTGGGAVSTLRVLDYYNNEPQKTVWQKALEIAADLLEDEAVRRAKEGTQKPVFQGGQLVGHVQEYSDTLMIFLLKGAKPKKYVERLQQEVSGPDGGPIKAEVTVEFVKPRNSGADVS